jgi:hypothetical protein
MEFCLSPEQVRRYKAWREQLVAADTKMGAIGGAFSFVFIPTTLGTIIKVRFSCYSKEAELDLTDYNEW